MKKTNLDILIEKEIKKDSSLEKELNQLGQAIDIAIRIYKLRRQLRLECPQIFTEQKHLDKGEARDYWHYGYLMAMLDITKNFELKQNKEEYEKNNR
jgi:hypothetical protein